MFLEANNSPFQALTQPRIKLQAPTQSILFLEKRQVGAVASAPGLGFSLSLQKCDENVFLVPHEDAGQGWRCSRYLCLRRASPREATSRVSGSLVVSLEGRAIGFR